MRTQLQLFGVKRVRGSHDGTAIPAITNWSNATSIAVDIALIRSCGEQDEASEQGNRSFSVGLVKNFGEKRVKQHGRRPEGGFFMRPQRDSYMEP